MTKAVIMSRFLQSSGTKWYPRGWRVYFNSDSLIDNIVIRNDGNLSEKISMTLEEAESFVDFIQEAKRAYRKMKSYEENMFEPFADEEPPK